MSRKQKRKSNKINVKGNQNKVVQNTNAQNIDLSEKVTIEKTKNTVYNSDIKANLVHIGDRFEIRYDSGKIVKAVSVFDFFTQKTDENITKLIYQDYLNENILPYVKRSNFKQRENTPKDFIDENDILQSIETKLGSIIIGQGGTGKTRTMYEVAKLAHKANWQTLVIQPNFTEVDFLLSNLNIDSKYLLVFDYIEESKSFADIINYIVENRKNEQIKILANCRKSYYDNLKIQLYTSQHLFEIVDFTDKNTQTAEAAYQKYVSKRIIYPVLQKAKLKQNKRDRFFKLRSSFAVFLRYLYDKGDKNLNLHQFDNSFEAWLIKRFKLTIGNDKFNDEIIKQLLLLPVFGEEVDNYLDKYEINEKLITDGWLQENEQYNTERLDTVHDTVKDELLIYYLNKETETERKLRRQINKHLQFAIQNNGLKNWLRAYERIIDEPIFTDYPDFFYSFFTKNLKKENFPEFDSYLLIKSALLTEKQKFDIIAEKPDFFKDFIYSENFALPLAFALNFYSKKENTKQTPISLRTLADNWITNNTNFTEDGLIADRIISTYLKKYGQNEKIKPFLNKFIEKADSSCGNYTIAAWLDQKGDKEFVKKYLENYLKENATDKEAQFVFKAWLDHEGAVNFIREYVYKYLTIHADYYKSSFVYQAYLKKAKTDKDNLKPYLQKWLKKYAEQNNTKYLFSLWLLKTKDNNFIKPFLSKWLEKNSNDEFGSLLMEQWIENGGDYNKI